MIRLFGDIDESNNNNKKNYSGKVRQFMASFVLLKIPEIQALHSVGLRLFCLGYCSWGLNWIPVITCIYTEVGQGERRDELCTLYNFLLVKLDFNLC